MSNVPGHYHAEGDPPETVRYWDGSQWVGDPIPAPPAGAAAPPAPGSTVDSSRFGTVGIRIGAYLIDAVIGIAIAFVALLVFFSDDVDNSDGFSGSADTGGSIVLGLALYAIFLGILIWQSSTPGKLMLGLSITKADGTTPLDPPTAFKRSLPFLLGSIPIAGLVIWLVFVIGSLIAISNDGENRSLYDRIGNTRVVYKNKL